MATPLLSPALASAIASAFDVVIAEVCIGLESANSRSLGAHEYEVLRLLASMQECIADMESAIAMRYDGQREQRGRDACARLVAILNESMDYRQWSEEYVSRATLDVVRNSLLYLSVHDALFLYAPLALLRYLEATERGAPSVLPAEQRLDVLLQSVRSLGNALTSLRVVERNARNSLNAEESLVRYHVALELLPLAEGYLTRVAAADPMLREYIEEVREIGSVEFPEGLAALQQRAAAPPVSCVFAR